MKLRKLMCVGLTISMLASLTGGAGMVYASDSAETTEAEAAEETAEAAAPEETAEETVEDSAEEAADSAEAAADGEIAPENISVTWEDSRFYPELTLGQFRTLKTYGVNGYEEVPFITVNDYLEILFKGKARVSTDNGVMTVDVKGTQIVIDPAADTIHFEDPSKLRSSASPEGGIVEEEEANVVIPSLKHEFVTTAASSLDVSLKDYNMPVIPYEDTIIMPFLALQNTIGALSMNSIYAYNGKDYYNVHEAKNFLLGDDVNPAAKESPYIKAISSGPWHGRTETSKDYANYGYYSICLLLDLTFGHKEEKGITTFDEYFTRMNAKNAMSSTNPTDAVLGEILLLNYLFDSGHDSVGDMNSVFGDLIPPKETEVGEVVEDIKTSEEGDALFDENAVNPEDTQSTTDMILGVLTEKGFKIPEVAPLLVWTTVLNNLKPEDYGNQRLDYAGDTAVIYFNAFKEDAERSPSYYLDPITEEDISKDTFAFFYNCFEDIKTHDEVKNVVLNICDNGGGAACSLVSVLGFLSEDGEVHITSRDLPAGSYKEEWYHVDTNLDGVADDEDGYGGQYDFYIMCSGSSYSCGNALPYYAQKEGLAKIFGTPPGGGDCVVGSFVDAYGRIGAYSGMLKLGTEDENGFVSDEKATTIDLNMMPNIWDVNSVPWFDPEGIADAVHQYQEGATELTYDVDPGVVVSDFVTGLLGQIEGLAETVGSDQETLEGAEAADAAGEPAEGAEETPETAEGAEEVPETAEEVVDEAA